MESILLAEAREEILKADQKASSILTTLGIGFGAITGGLLAGNWTPATLHGFRQVSWWMGAFSAVLSVWAAASAIWPRYTKVDAKDGITFWGHVATFDTLAAFTEALNKTGVDDGYRTRHQLWRISKIVDKKFCLIRWSLALSGVAVGLLAFAAWARF